MKHPGAGRLAPNWIASGKEKTLSPDRTGAPITTEVELKLAAGAADLPALKRALAAMAPGSSQAKLTSTYYDTPDLALKRMGLTLRVREQCGRFVQTVKAGEVAAAGMLSRGEWEDELAEGRPDPGALRSGSRLPQDLAGDLHPLFITEVTRTAVAIEPTPGTTIEAAIDEGEIRAAGGDAIEPLSEVELELKGGDAAAIYDIALGLLETAPLRIETRSKSERGYSLADGAAAAPRAYHADPVALDRGMAVEAALREIGRSCLVQMLRNEPLVLAAHPEALHQMRVALRRIRSAVSSLKEALPAEDRRWLAKELGWLSDVLGPARNLDVFVKELLPSARAALAAEPGWEELSATLDRLRRGAYDRVRDEILSVRYTAAFLRLSRWFESFRQSPGQCEAPAKPVGEIAPRILDRRRRGVRRRSEGFGRLTPRERHKLRIAAKKLRYTVELFGGLFDDDSKKFISRLKRLQDDLGYANDVRVAHEFLIELFAQIEPRSPAAHAWIGLLEWHDQILAGRERKLRRHLRRLNSTPPAWRSSP